MSIEKLDLLFPFFVFAYGGLMTFVLNNPDLMELAENRMPHTVLQQMRGHRVLALICLGVGSLWSLQNLWL